MKEKIFIEKPPLWSRVWFYLTCWRPVTKYEILQLQRHLVIILEGMREGDLQHHQMEHAIMEELKKLKDSGTKESRKREQKNDEMFG
jgi:hypothetical protein